MPSKGGLAVGLTVVVVAIVVVVAAAATEDPSSVAESTSEAAQRTSPRRVAPPRPTDDRPEVTGLFATWEEVRRIYRPRWDAGWTLGLPNERDHRAMVDRRAARLTPAGVYAAGPEGFDSSVFRSVARDFAALAWRYLAEGDAEDLETARAFLLAQAAPASIDWTAWPRGHRDLDRTDRASTYEDSHAVAGLVHGYSIIRSTLSRAERERVDAWFVAWADLATSERVARMRTQVQNWEEVSDPADYRWDTTEPVERSIATIGLPDRAYDGSPTLHVAHYNYNNRWSSMMRTVAMIGVVTGTDRFVDHGARFVKESLAFGWWPEGFHVDFHRGIDNGSVAYAALATSHLITIADVLLRHGYENLYEYETTTGYLGTAGSFPGRTGKDIEGAIIELGKHYTGHYRRRASTNGGEAPLVGSWTRGDQLRLALANVYYRDLGAPRSLYACEADDACPTIPPDQLDDAWTLDKEAGPTLFHVAADRETSPVWPYPTDPRPSEAVAP